MPNGVEIRYRYDGKLFNLRRLRAKTKVTTTNIVELQYADDTAACASSEEDLQEITNAFFTAYLRLGLTLNVKKTEVLYQPATTQDVGGEAQPRIKVGDKTLETTKCFKYLGSNISANATIDDEIAYRISCAAAAFGRLKQRVFDNRDLKLHTKTLVYNAIVLLTLRYG